MSKTNPDYSASAVGLTNPSQVFELLVRYHKEAKALTTISEAIDKVVPQKLKDQKSILEKSHQETDKILRQAIDTFGSYQDLDNGWYAVKQRRESITYLPDFVRRYAPAKVAEFVIIETVDSKALDALLKAGQLEPEVARQCGTIEEKFAYIIR